MKSNIRLFIFWFLIIQNMHVRLGLGQSGIEITSGGSVTLTGAATVEITNGDLVNNGTWTRGTETVTLSGSSAKVISGSSNTTLYNLNVTNTAGISSQVARLTANNLTVASGSSFTIDPSKAVTVEGTLANNADNTALVLRSTAAGTAALLHSTASVKATVQRYVAAWDLAGGHGGWHFLSSPVLTEDIRPQFVPMSNTPGSIHQDFYKWDEAQGLWINTLNEDGSWNSAFESTFTKGRGYMVAFDASVTKVFRDSLNVTGVTLTGLTNSTGKTFQGWHLAGNPFSCAIGWNQGSWVKTNIGTYAQVWNNATKSYKVLRGEGIIPAMSGFMIYTSGSGELTIPADARLISDSAWYKSGDAAGEEIVLTVTDNEGGGSQETVIRFGGSATTGFDMYEDCLFMAGFAPSFYSVSDDILLALSTLPPPDNATRIPLGFVKNGSSHFTLSLTACIPGLTPWLTDNKTGQSVSLLQHREYSFTAVEGDDANRFVLRFGSTGTGNEPAPHDIRISGSENMLKIFSDLPCVATIIVYDLMGREVFRSGDNLHLPAVLSPGLSTGYFVVKVITGRGIVTGKVRL